MSDPDDKSDDDAEGREWTALDDLYGEWIARDLHDRVSEETEHYRRAHNRGTLDAVADFLFGTDSAEECINPRCDAERFEAEDSGELESWWERWFRGPGSDDGESGSSD